MNYSLVITLGSFFGFIAGAYLTDAIGRRKNFIFWAITCSCVVVAYTWLPVNDTTMLFLGFPLGFFVCGIYGGIGAYLTELFPTRIRATAQSFTYNFGRAMGAAVPFAIGALSSPFRSDRRSASSPSGHTPSCSSPCCCCPRPTGPTSMRLTERRREADPFKADFEKDQQKKDNRQMAKQLRRVVTGHDARGRAIVQIDEIAPTVVNPRPGSTATLIWSTDTLPADNGDSRDGGVVSLGTSLETGSVFRVVEYAPGVSPRNHRTQSIDYAVVMSGEIDMALDDTEVHLKAATTYSCSAGRSTTGKIAAASRAALRSC